MPNRGRAKFSIATSGVRGQRACSAHKMTADYTTDEFLQVAAMKTRMDEEGASR